MSVTRYPLSWPTGWKRTPAQLRTNPPWCRRETRTRDYGNGQTTTWTTKGELTVAQAIERLQGELDRLGARDPILSTNLQVRLDGLPRSGQATPTDPGVAIYFTLKGKDRCLACDRWRTVAGNLAALAAHIGALRGIERWGVGTLDQAFTGYTALPPGEDEWWLVLGVSRAATLDEIEAAYRAKAREAHPDTGGKHNDMTRLNAARDAARKALSQ